MDLLRRGNYLEPAAARAGVAKGTLYGWLREGARDRAAGRESALCRFAEGVIQAEAEAEANGIDVISKAAEDRVVTVGKGKKRKHIVVPGNWPARSWILERRHPERWGRRAPGPAPAAPPPPSTEEVAPATAREKLLKELAGIRERRRAGAA